MTTYNTKSPAVKRLMREAQELSQPTELYYAQPLEDNLFEWHFTIRGPEGSEFEGGIYHGQISLPTEYPMKPPNIMLLTPNGRFEQYRQICLSISGYHPETWCPSWSIRTALLAIIGFMPTSGAGAIGSLSVPTEERKKLAASSKNYVCDICGPTKDLLLPLTSASSSTAKEAKEVASQFIITDPNAPKVANTENQAAPVVPKIPEPSVVPCAAQSQQTPALNGIPKPAYWLCYPVFLRESFPSNGIVTPSGDMRKEPPLSFEEWLKKVHERPSSPDISGSQSSPSSTRKLSSNQITNQVRVNTISPPPGESEDVNCDADLTPVPPPEAATNALPVECAPVLPSADSRVCNSPQKTNLNPQVDPCQKRDPALLTNPYLKNDLVPPADPCQRKNLAPPADPCQGQNLVPLIDPCQKDPAPLVKPSPKIDLNPPVDPCQMQNLALPVDPCQKNLIPSANSCLKYDLAPPVDPCQRKDSAHQDDSYCPPSSANGSVHHSPRTNKSGQGKGPMPPDDSCKENDIKPTDSSKNPGSVCPSEKSASSRISKSSRGKDPIPLDGSPQENDPKPTDDSGLSVSKNTSSVCASEKSAAPRICESSQEKNSLPDMSCPSAPKSSIPVSGSKESGASPTLESSLEKNSIPSNVPCSSAPESSIPVCVSEESGAPPTCESSQEKNSVPSNVPCPSDSKNSVSVCASDKSSTSQVCESSQDKASMPSEHSSSRKLGPEDSCRVSRVSLGSKDLPEEGLLPKEGSSAQSASKKSTSGNSGTSSSLCESSHEEELLPPECRPGSSGSPTTIVLDDACKGGEPVGVFRCTAVKSGPTALLMCEEAPPFETTTKLPNEPEPQRPKCCVTRGPRVVPLCPSREAAKEAAQRILNSAAAKHRQRVCNMQARVERQSSTRITTTPARGVGVISRPDLPPSRWAKWVALALAFALLALLIRRLVIMSTSGPC